MTTVPIGLSEKNLEDYISIEDIREADPDIDINLSLFYQVHLYGPHARNQYRGKAYINNYGILVGEGGRTFHYDWDIERIEVY